jgi:hypothetical protein
LTDGANHHHLHSTVMHVGETGPGSECDVILAPKLNDSACRPRNFETEFANLNPLPVVANSHVSRCAGP